MSKAIAVLGTGAIGSSVGADLTMAGHDVTFIDQWPAHVEAMKANGLKVVMPDQEFVAPVTAHHLCDVCSLNRRFDLVLLASKSYDTRWLAEFIRPWLADDGVLVSMQNGMNEETTVPIVGRERVIGCAFELSAEVFTPGLVQRNTLRERTWFGLGELDGSISARLKALEAIMSCVGTAALTHNIRGAKWSKLVNSSMILAPFGMLKLQSWQAIEIPEVFRLCIQLGRETIAVGAALGIEMEPIFGLSAAEFAGSTDEIVEKLLKTIVIHHGETSRQVRGVVLQDYLKGRLTETDWLSGLVARKGKEAGVSTPANAAVVEINRRIQAGELKPERANLALVEQMLRG